MKFDCKEKCKYADKDGACHLECVEKKRKKKKRMLKKVLCAYCKEIMHVDDFGGIDKNGIYHSKCIVKKLCKEKKDAKSVRGLRSKGR